MRFRPPSGARTEPPPADDAAAWITGASPDGWFTEPPEVVVDRDEIIIWGRVPTPELGADATDADRSAAQAGRIHQFREDTRDDRIKVALQVEHRYQRKVSWGVRCGDSQELFTHLSAPVMTRLRQPERLPRRIRDLVELAEAELPDGSTDRVYRARGRAVIDYVAALTDSQAVALMDALSGRTRQLWTDAFVL